MRFTVAIVGRPNVGKSTFFNRLIGHRKSIVDDISGVTRDRIYDIAEWNGKQFYVIDTGGFVAHSQDVFEKAIRRQVELAIEESSAIVYMVDVLTGITDLDEFVAGLLRKVNKKKFLVVNKVDNHERLLMAQEFWSLGFDQLYPVSAITGSGTGELLDDLATLIPPEEIVPEDLPKFAIVGQPNVGKSSLINALLGEERNMVTEIAGTTRDPIHSEYNKFGKRFMLIDTAGIRKKARVSEDLEFYSVMRAIKSIEEADVCFLVIDATLGLEMQDMELFSLIIKRNKGLVFLVNKWDLIKKETNTAVQFEKQIKEKIAPFTDVPILFISALEKQRVFQAIETGLQVFENRNRKITTSKLNDIILKAIEAYHPPVVRGHPIKIKFVTQLPTVVPSFAFYCNFPDDVKQPYKNYLENKLRENFDLKGVPVRLFFRKK